MKLKLLLAFFLASQFAFSQWTPISSGTTDNLTGIAMRDSNGLVSGENGLYYTTNQAVSWTPYTIIGNPADQLVYNNTSFRACASPLNFQPTVSMYACGKDNLTNRAVIFKINFPSLTHEIVYTGPVGSSLNSVAYYENNNTFFAVGDNGLVVNFGDNLPAVVRNIDITDNLKSISFGSQFAMVGEDKLIFGYINVGVPEIADIVAMPNATSALSVNSNAGLGYGVGDSYATRNGSGLTNSLNFDFGPLNAKDIIENTSNYHLVATDHGIFKSGSSKTYLEWQPTSGTEQINDLYYVWQTGTSYACGNNGVILKSTNGGGIPQPYIKLDLTIRCFGSNSTIKALTGSSTSCQWSINGTVVNSSCGQFNYQFPALGTHTVSLTATNASGYSTTKTETVTIVNIPQVNQSVTISDQLLCQIEPIDITIENSEVNVVYTLRKSGELGSFGTSQNGTGGTITFTSAPIDEAGTYLLEAKSIFSTCSQLFTDSFVIEIDETQALFNASLINANVGEEFTVYNHSIDAQNQQWTFSTGGTVSSSNLEDVQLSYTAVGATEISLHSWSENNCHSTTTAIGPYIYTTPTPVDSWTIVNSGTDVDNNHPEIGQWTGNWELESTELVKLPDGLLTTGRYKDLLFASRAGNSLDMAGKSGGYLAKHDLNGVLKFVVYTVKASTSVGDSMTSAVADSQGNIYITCNTLGYFYDSTGTRFDFGTNDWPNAKFIIKLDSQGRYLWRLQARMLFPSNLYIDTQDNLVATSIIVYQQPIELMLNGLNTGQFFTPMDIAGSTADNEYVITKFSADGTMIWNAPVYIEDVNGSYLTSVSFDVANNIYMTGIFEQSIDMHSVNGAIHSLEGIIDNYGGKTFVAKYNPAGIVQWLIRSFTTGPLNSATIPYDMITDASGNSFITGKNDCTQPTYYHRFENQDGTITEANIGQFYVAKVNTNGICEWIRGTDANGGVGYQIIKHDDEVTAIGYIVNEESNSQTFNFNSTNGFSFPLTTNSSELILVTYDSAGSLLRITGNVESDDNYSTKYFSGFAKGEGDSYYLAGNMRVEEGSTFNLFSTTILPTNEDDAFLAKFNEASGIQHYNSNLGIENSNLNSEMRLYPNPSTGNFTIALATTLETVSLEILDITGKKIFAENYSNVSEINANINGASGIYFAKVISGTQVSRFKLNKK